MNELKIFLQFVAIIFIIYLIYLFVKYIISVKKRARLADFSININEDDTEESLTFKLLFKVSALLESLVIFNGISRTYDEYIDENSRLKKGIDYISIKILSGLFLIIIYFLLIFLYKNEISVTLILVNFILGYIIPDFYCLYISNKNNRLTNHTLLNAIIIMSNSYKAGRSTEQAISDVISRSETKVKKEFSRALNDIKLGMSPADSFRRMAKRTRNKTILTISHYLSCLKYSTIPTSAIFNMIEQKIITQEKENDEIKHLSSTNALAAFIFTILPLIFILYTMFIQIDISMLFLSDYGLFVFLIIMISYILYCFIIYRVGKGDKYE